MSSSRRDPLVGTTVEDRYEVLDRVARGGMSTVYRALDRRLDRMVALKVMHPHLAEDPALVARFEREAKTTARISHPHVVAVLDQGHTVDASGDTVAYLVMEFVPGRTLRSVIRAEAPLTPRRALDLLMPTLAGLAAAHRAGLVHRDVKPENVLVREDGRVTVADFGLSRAATGHTSTGQAVLGTPAYLAPEHISGEPADTRADVYAAGILLFELLTGRQPFTAASPLQVAYRHLHERVPVPSSLVPGLAERLDDLVLWCTEPDPRDRPQDATALLDALERVRAGLSDVELDHRPPPEAREDEGPGPEDPGPRDGTGGRKASETVPVPRHALATTGALDDDATRTLPVGIVAAPGRRAEPASRPRTVPPVMRPTAPAGAARRAPGRTAGPRGSPSNGWAPASAGRWRSERPSRSCSPAWPCSWGSPSGPAASAGPPGRWSLPSPDWTRPMPAPASPTPVSPPRSPRATTNACPTAWCWPPSPRSAPPSTAAPPSR